MDYLASTKLNISGSYYCNGNDYREYETNVFFGFVKL